MGIDEADRPAQQPNRSLEQQQAQQNSSSNGGGGLLEAPRPPVVTTPGAVNVRQQPHNDSNKRKENGDNTEGGENDKQEANDNLAAALSMNNPTSAAENLECAPSRQSDSDANKPSSSGTQSQVTLPPPSRPGVYAVPGMIQSNSNVVSSNVTSMASNQTTSTTTTNTTTSNTVTTGASEASPNTIITATKVDDEASNNEVNEAVRLAQEEAEQLRQQVRSLQQERNQQEGHANNNNQVLVVATAAADDKVSQDHKSSQTKCLWMVLLVVLVLGVLIGGGIAIYMATTEEAVVITSFPTIAPTMAPTIPCLSTIIPPDDKNYTGRLKPLLEICQGDCNVDSDCADGLICFHRNGPYDPVPGCGCWESDATRNDYCIEIPSDPCLVETNDYPLGMCEGHCKSNDDCQFGLMCAGILPGSMVAGCQFCETPEEPLGNDVMVPIFVPGDGNETDVWNSFGNETTDSNTTDPEDNNFSIGIVNPDMEDPDGENQGGTNNNNSTQDFPPPMINNGTDTESRPPDFIPTDEGNEFTSTIVTTNENGRRKLEEEPITRAPTPAGGGFIELTRNPTVDDWMSRPPKTEYPTGKLPLPDQVGQELPPPPNVRYCIPIPEDSFSTINNDPGVEEEEDMQGQRQPDGEDLGRIVSGGIALRSGILVVIMMMVSLLLSW